jgi:uncharacterized protein YfaS (alpha-2-macroglobulin family)
MQKAPQSICANAGIAPSAKLKMTLIRTDRIMAFTQQKNRDQSFIYQEQNAVFFEYCFLSDRPT